MKKILEVPHLIQFYDIEDPQWQERTCAIVSLVMVMGYYGKEVNLEEAVEKGQKIKVKDPKLGTVGGYDPEFGWRHDAIVGLAKHYGFKSYRKEDDTIESLMESLEKQEPVIINIYKNFDPENGGHLAVLTGYYVADTELIGFYVNDPIGPSYKHKDQFIELENFERGWKKRAIYVTKAVRSISK